MDDGAYLLGTDNAYHTAEREAERESVQALVRRFGITLSAYALSLAAPPRDASERARARIAVLERQVKALRREAFAAVGHREREMLDLERELRRARIEGRHVSSETAEKQQRNSNETAAKQQRNRPGNRPGNHWANRRTPQNGVTISPALRRSIAGLMSRDPPDPQSVEREEDDPPWSPTTSTT